MNTFTSNLQVDDCHGIIAKACPQKLLSESPFLSSELAEKRMIGSTDDPGK